MRRVEDLIAWQLAVQFGRCVYSLVRSNREPNRDLRYRDELFDAIGSIRKNIAEGFNRNRTRVFIQFLGYAKGSLGEAQEGILDGIDRGYFTAEQCEPALRLAKRCFMAILRLIQSLERFL